MLESDSLQRLIAQLAKHIATCEQCNSPEMLLSHKFCTFGTILFNRKEEAVAEKRRKDQASNSSEGDLMEGEEKPAGGHWPEERRAAKKAEKAALFPFDRLCPQWRYHQILPKEWEMVLCHVRDNTLIMTVKPKGRVVGCKVILVDLKFCEKTSDEARREWLAAVIDLKIMWAVSEIDEYKDPRPLLSEPKGY